jgi:conjugative relaxase-like TrwC/TraI family protein
LLSASVCVLGDRPRPARQRPCAARRLGVVVVISVAMLAAGSDPAGYYLARTGGCAADYYTGASERAGVWLGSGAAQLALSGQLDPTGEKVLRSLLDGRAPDGRVLVAKVLRADPRGRLPARPLVEAIRDRADQLGVPVENLLADPGDRARFSALAARVDKATRRREPTLAPGKAGRLATAVGLDPHEVYRTADGDDRFATAVRFADRRVDARKAGADVTISAPKSVSVALGLGSPEVAAAVRAGHQAAVGEALAYLESVAGHGLRGHQGDGQRAERISTGGWIVAAFEHRTSRAGDPQLHTHLVVPNLLRGVDGKWSAIDSRTVHRHALTASYLYHAVLRGQLTARLGVAWTTPEKGIAEIVGIPADLLAMFSTRREQIERAMDERGVSGPEAAQAACLATRPAKAPGEPDGRLRERWAAQAREAGHDPDRVVDAAVGRARPPQAPSMRQLTEHLLGPTGLTAQTTGFDRRDLIQALCQDIPTGLPVGHSSIQAAADLVLRHRDAVRLATRSEDGPRWSTTELLGVEQAALHIAEQLRASAHLVVPDAVDSAGVGRALTGEQQRMVRSLAAADGLAVVVGPAGSGKTAALAEACRAWTEQGRPAVGAAVAAVTARRLEHATGLPATSLARLLAAAGRTDPTTGRMSGLARGAVVVVDEASMVDTRALAMLLAHTHAAGGTLVLVGDPAQLPEIGAGGLFAALARHEDTVRLTDNQRQADAWERRALADLRAGDPEAAVAAYAEHDRIHTAPANQLADRIVDDYLRRTDLQRAQGATGPPGQQVVMLAARRADVADLNDTARVRLLDAGRLGPVAVTVGEGKRRREYRAGDQVIVTANDYQLGVLNGTRAEVAGIDPRHRTLTLATDDQRSVPVPAEWAARHLDHGYAMTCHKAQGATVDTALLYGTGALSREAGYVALSRGRTSNHLYVRDDNDSDVGRPTQVAAESHLDWLAARLAVRHTQTLASRQLPRTDNNRWRSPTRHDPPHRHIEGISL